MSIVAWPFFVSRNRYLDYRTIVAPDFICQAKISNLLASVAEGELTNSAEIIIRQIVNSKVDDFTIIFQVILAIEKDISFEGSNKILKDQFGREIYLFEGIVLKGIGEDYIYINDLDLEKVHKQLIVIYRHFWNQLEPCPVIPSRQFSIPVTNNRVLNRQIKPRYNASSH